MQGVFYHRDMNRKNTVWTLIFVTSSMLSNDPAEHNICITAFSADCVLPCMKGEKQQYPLKNVMYDHALCFSRKSSNMHDIYYFCAYKKITDAIHGAKDTPIGEELWIYDSRKDQICSKHMNAKSIQIFCLRNRIRYTPDQHDTHLTDMSPYEKIQHYIKDSWRKYCTDTGHHDGHAVETMLAAFIACAAGLLGPLCISTLIVFLS